MFEFLFKYPTTVFAKGSLVLLSGWPVWILAAAIVALAAVLGWQIRRNHALGARRVAVWLLETAFVALVLLLLWHPAISIASLKPQENIVAVLVDDSRSMGIREDGKTRIEQALATLNGGLVSKLKQKFQVRVYRFGADLERVDKTDSLTAAQPASHLAGSLTQMAAEASSLPIGAAVVLSDGAENSGGIGLDTISQLKRRRLPVHTIGYGREHPSRDVEIEEAVLPARALANSNVVAAVTLRQYGYEKQKARLVARDGGKTLASQEITLKGAGVDQTESLMIQAGAAGARSIEITVESLAGEENVRNNMLTRVVNVSAQKPRILYIEGEPRWEMKFIRRALEEDTALHLVSILRTTENKIYRQGIESPTELENGFPSKAEDLFAFQGLIIGSVDAGYFTPGQQELIRDFVDRRGGGVLFLGGRAALSEGGYTRSPLFGSAARYPAEPQRHVPPRFGRARADSYGPRERHPAADRKSGGEPRALEEDARASGLSGSGRTQARRGHACAAWAPAFAGHGELRARAHGGVRHGRKLALAYAAGSHGPHARDFLAPVPALARSGHAGAGAVLDAEAGALGRRVRDARGRGARQVVPLGL